MCEEEEEEEEGQLRLELRAGGGRLRGQGAAACEAGRCRMRAGVHTGARWLGQACAGLEYREVKAIAAAGAAAVCCHAAMHCAESVVWASGGGALWCA